MPHPKMVLTRLLCKNIIRDI